MCSSDLNDDQLRPEGTGVATVPVDDEQYRRLADDEVETHLAENDLLNEE